MTYLKPNDTSIINSSNSNFMMMYLLYVNNRVLTTVCKSWTFRWIISIDLRDSVISFRIQVLRQMLLIKIKPHGKSFHYIGSLAVAKKVLWITVCSSFCLSFHVGSFLGIGPSVFLKLGMVLRPHVGFCMAETDFSGKIPAAKITKNSSKTGFVIYMINSILNFCWKCP